VQSLKATLLALAIVIALAACGEEAEPDLVEAREGNTVELEGVRYRVVTFRQLNPRIAPDQALWDGPPPDEDRALFAAFMRACNVSDDRAAPTPDIHLEDAFGQVFRPVGLARDNELAYRPRPLDPGRCLPSEDTVPSRALPGAAIVFTVPVDQLGERPFVLELRGRAGEDGAPVRRVQLDL